MDEINKEQNEATISFMLDLANLLDKHNAEMTLYIDDDYAGFQKADLLLDVCSDKIRFCDKTIVSKVDSSGVTAQDLRINAGKLKN